MSVKLKNIKSSGFLDGYKASNFESNSSVIKYHEEELTDLLRLLAQSLFKNEQQNESDKLLQGYLKKAEDKLISVNDYKEAESVYIRSVENFKSFIETLVETKDFNIPPSAQLMIKKILNHYKILGEKSLIEQLESAASKAEKKFLIPA